jgi:hypothetical protein
LGIQSNHLPNPFDLKPVHKTIAAFLAQTQYLWKLFPVIKLTAVIVFFSPHSLTSLLKKFRRFHHWIFSKGNRSTLAEVFGKIGRKDVIIAFSSPKPSWYPALQDLGQSLSLLNIPTYILNRSKVEYKNSQKNISLDLFENDVFSKFGIFKKLSIISASFAATLLTTLSCAFSGSPWSILKNIPFFFFEFVESYNRIHVAELLIKCSGCRVVITNGEHLPICSELMYAANRLGKYPVWFYNEWPTSAFVPSLSREVWTWNRVTASAIRSVLPTPNRIRVEEVGRAEAEYSSHIYRNSSIDEDLNWIQQSQHHGAILLLDYTGNPDIEDKNDTYKMLVFIYEAARKSPKWRFLLKPRPFKNKTRIPGEELVAGSGNCRILRNEGALGPFLALDTVKVVAGCTSSGLFTAACVGKYSVRLMISAVNHPLPYIDTIAIQVDTVDGFLRILTQIEAGELSSPHRENKDLFPYRGQVMQRMRHLAVQRLAEWSQKKTH